MSGGKPTQACFALFADREGWRWKAGFGERADRNVPAVFSIFCASWPRPTSVVRMSFDKFSSSLNFTSESSRDWNYALTSQVRGVGEGGWDVFSTQSRVLLQDVFRGGAVCKVVEDDGHWDARSVEVDGSVEDLRIGGDDVLPVHSGLDARVNGHSTREGSSGAAGIRTPVGCDA
jgi:hypothetical protein